MADKIEAHRRRSLADKTPGTTRRDGEDGKREFETTSRQMQQQQSVGTPSAGLVSQEPAQNIQRPVRRNKTVAPSILERIAQLQEQHSPDMDAQEGMFNKVQHDAEEFKKEKYELRQQGQDGKNEFGTTRWQIQQQQSVGTPSAGLVSQDPLQNIERPVRRNKNVAPSILGRIALIQEQHSRNMDAQEGKFNMIQHDAEELKKEKDELRQMNLGGKKEFGTTSQQIQQQQSVGTPRAGLVSQEPAQNIEKPVRRNKTVAPSLLGRLALLQEQHSRNMQRQEAEELKKERDELRSELDRIGSRDQIFQTLQTPSLIGFTARATDFQLNTREQVMTHFNFVTWNQGGYWVQGKEGGYWVTGNEGGHFFTAPVTGMYVVNLNHTQTGDGGVFLNVFHRHRLGDHMTFVMHTLTYHKHSTGYGYTVINMQEGDSLYGRVQHNSGSFSGFCSVILN